MSDNPNALQKSILKKQQKMAPEQLNMAAAAGEGRERLEGVPLRAAGTMDGKLAGILKLKMKLTPANLQSSSPPMRCGHKIPKKTAR